MRTILILTLLPLCLVILLGAILLSNPEMQYHLGQAFVTGALPKNYDAGIFWLKRAADGGYADAQSVVGRYLLFGIPKQDLSESIKYLSMGEKKDDVECLKLLSYAYAYGQGVPQDYKKSLSLSKRVLKKESDAREIMSLSFLKLVLPKPYRNYKEANRLAVELAAKGYTSPWAYWCLGTTNEFGLGTKCDYKKARGWYERGAALGDDDCQYAIARMLLDGHLKRDESLARRYLIKAANSQFLDAQILLALMYALDPNLSAKTSAEFKTLLSNLSARGFKEYSACLAAISSKSTTTYSTTSPRQPSTTPNGTTFNGSMSNVSTRSYGRSVSKAAFASTFMKELEGLDNTKYDGVKHLTLCLIKRYGLIGNVDHQGFLHDLDEAIRLGSVDAAAWKANLCCGLELGDPDYEQAVPLYTKAAQKEHAFAQGQLGMLYALGFGVKHDWPSAIMWLTKASDQGECVSQYCLGGFYSDGRGVKPDRQKAVKLFEKSALQGDQDSCLEMGVLLSSGEFPDLNRDVGGGVRWFKKAADSGVQEANYYLGGLGLNAFPSQEDVLKTYKQAADKGHLLSELQVGKYHLERGKLDEARNYFKKAEEEGNKEAIKELHILALRQATFKYHPDSTHLVVAKQDIPKGTIITRNMLKVRQADDLKASEPKKETAPQADETESATDTSKRTDSETDTNNSADQSVLRPDDDIITDTNLVIGTKTACFIQEGSYIKEVMIEAQEPK